MTSRSGKNRLLRHALVLALVFGWAGALSTFLYAPPAAAQRDMKKARRAFKKGKRLYEQDKYERATRQFKKAYEYSNRSELLYNIGQSYRKSGELKKAETYFQKYLDENPEASNRQEVLDKVVAIQEELAARMASVEVESETAGGSVYVDDEEKARCSTPCTVSLEPGSHELRVESEGETVETKSIEVEKGGSDKLAFGKEKAEESETAPAKLHLKTRSGGGSVFVEQAGETSLPMSEPMELEPGTHNIQVTDDSGNQWSGSVSVESGQTTRLLVTTTPQDLDEGASASGGGGGGGSLKRSIAYGLGGASLASLTGGLLLGRNAQQTYDLLENQNPRNGAVNSELVEKGKREQTAANVLFGVGAATFLSSVGLFTWDLVGSGGD